MSKRKCLNPNCGLEDDYSKEVRFCPECGWEIEGWESKTMKELKELRKRKAKKGRGVFLGDGYAE